MRKMASKILNTSVPEEQARFLEENPDFSPSKLLQSKIVELMENSRDWTAQLKRANEKIERIMITLSRQIDFITSKNLMEEFMKWKN